MRLQVVDTTVSLVHFYNNDSYFTSEHFFLNANFIFYLQDD